MCTRTGGGPGCATCRPPQPPCTCRHPRPSVLWPLHAAGLLGEGALSQAGASGETHLTQGCQPSSGGGKTVIPHPYAHGVLGPTPPIPTLSIFRFSSKYHMHFLPSKNRFSSAHRLPLRSAPRRTGPSEPTCPGSPSRDGTSCCNLPTPNLPLSAPELEEAPLHSSRI